MTRLVVAATAGALAAFAAWVLWILSHAPADGDPCDLCGARVVPPTYRRSPHHPVYHHPQEAP